MTQFSSDQTFSPTNQQYKPNQTKPNLTQANHHYQHQYQQRQHHQTLRHLRRPDMHPVPNTSLFRLALISPSLLRPKFFHGLDFSWYLALFMMLAATRWSAHY